MRKWEMVELGEVFSRIANGASIKQSDNAKGYPITRIETISNSEIDRERFGYADIFDVSNYEDFILLHGDILMSHINSMKHLGKTAIYHQQDDETIIHGMNLLCLRPKREKLSEKFASYYFNSNAFKNQIPRIANQSVNQCSFSVSKLKTLKIPLPPLPIQRQIAEVLDTADALRQATRQQLAALDELAQAVFLEMFGDVVRNEKGFERGTIREIVSEVRYGTSAKASDKGEFPYLRMNNITYSGAMDFSDLKYIDLSETDKEKYIVKKGDLLFNRTNSKELVGKTAVFKEVKPMAIAGYLIRVRPNERANTEYVSGYLNSKHGKATLQGMCKSIIGMANINAQELQNIEILIPPLPLQTQFAAIIANIEEQKAVLREALRESEGLFGGLLQAAF